MEKLGPYPLNSIITGDAKVLTQEIPDESVDLIFTDPVYDKMEDYYWLAQTSQRILKDNRPSLVWVAKAALHDVLLAMCPPLNYAWILENHRIGASNFGRDGKLITKLEACLWLEKGHSKPLDFVWDYHKSTDWPKFHALGWNKSESCLMRWLNVFLVPNGVVFDPFTGGGTIPAVCKIGGHKYLAFEIDPETAELARQRVANTQPPLFVPEPQQLKLSV